MDEFLERYFRRASSSIYLPAEDPSNTREDFGITGAFAQISRLRVPFKFREIDEILAPLFRGSGFRVRSSRFFSGFRPIYAPNCEIAEIVFGPELHPEVNLLCTIYLAVSKGSVLRGEDDDCEVAPDAIVSQFAMSHPFLVTELHHSSGLFHLKT